MDCLNQRNFSLTMPAQCSPVVASKWESGLRGALGISETALVELSERQRTGPIVSRLNQIANNAAAGCASIVAHLREVLDDRFWEESS
jgi:hypothetical protein